MTGPQAASELRGWIDYIVGWAFWIAVTALAIVFIATVAQKFGFSSRLFPTMPELSLLYLAGVAYLIKR